MAERESRSTLLIGKSETGKSSAVIKAIQRRPKTKLIYVFNGSTTDFKGEKVVHCDLNDLSKISFYKNSVAVIEVV